MISAASRGELAILMVVTAPSARVSTISTAEKNSSSAILRSRPRSSQYFTTFGSIGEVIPVMKSLECSWLMSKVGVI